MACIPAERIHEQFTDARSSLPRPAVALRATPRQPSLPSLGGLSRVCPAEAREASEGWWSQAGSNRRPLACHASALPAELWPLRLARAPWATREARKTLNTVQG